MISRKTEPRSLLSKDAFGIQKDRKQKEGLTFYWYREWNCENERGIIFVLGPRYSWMPFSALVLTWTKRDLLPRCQERNSGLWKKSLSVPIFRFLSPILRAYILHLVYHEVCTNALHIYREKKIVAPPSRFRKRGMAHSPILMARN